MNSEVLTCRTERETREAVSRAARVVREGGLVVFPTETVYGVAASVFSDRGMGRLRDIKQRGDGKPFSVHIGSPLDVERYVDLENHAVLRRLVKKTMPGPVTLVVEEEEGVIQEKLKRLGGSEHLRDRLYHGKSIGLRCPDDPIASAFLGKVEEPVVASSANPTGASPPTSAEQAAKAMGESVDLILDGGPTRYAKASTIIRVHGDKIEVMRDGVHDERYLKKLLRTTVLFVCSGNTCRSPMAEAIARHELGAAKRNADVQVVSAGTATSGGAGMTDEAVRALKKMGVSPGTHTSRPLSASLIHEADAIYGMTRSHVAGVVSWLPSAAGKTRLLDPAGGEITDPIGAGLDVYVKCAERMRKLIVTRLVELGMKSP